MMLESSFPEFLKSFGASLPWDQRMYRQDILGSQAHCRMLARQGIISDEEANAILGGLQEILQEIEDGRFPFSLDWEDIHMNVEHRLMEKIGEVGGKLHTARSRNDQVALDERLFLREEVDHIQSQILELMEVLVQRAEGNLRVIVPGYTHLQRAQPVLFSHHLLAYYEMFRRDLRRMEQCRESLLELPLGSGALAGVDFPIDRDFVARELGFSRICRNSLDAVSDRDFLLEFLAACSILGVHMSRLCEELVLWCSQEFGFVRLADPFCTGSSIMPQKRNPDFAELIRGKAGSLVGHLVSMLVTLKGLPLAYNKDMQEDKRPMLEAVDTVRGSLRVLVQMIRTMEVRPSRMAQATEEGYLTATDLADYLVAKGRPFRKAHGIVSEIVRSCLEREIPLSRLGLEELKAFEEGFEEDVYQVLDARASVERKASKGGTATARVMEALEQCRKELDELKSARQGRSP
ncbi:MAG: argininosuccinate lyase [Thermodesulfobacteriota bacterium]